NRVRFGAHPTLQCCRLASIARNFSRMHLRRTTREGSMLLRSTLLVCALTATLLCLACNKPSDQTIVTDIKARLYSEPLLKSSPLDVTAKDGTVTLSGQVPDDAARLAAQHIASTTPGVRTVVDQTMMAPALQAAVPTPVPVPAPPKRPA